MDEGKLRRDLSRATRARRILEDDLVVEAFATVEDAILKMFRDCDVDDDRVLRTARNTLECSRYFRHFFEKALADGKIAARDLKQLRRNRRIKNVR